MQFMIIGLEYWRVEMIEIYQLGNEFRVSDGHLAELLKLKPFILHQTTLKMIHSKSNYQPYQQRGAYFHTESGFIELAKYLRVSDEDYEMVITSFRYAREASDKRR